MFFALLAVSTTALSLNGYGLTLNENQVLYLFSTSSQVIAGIYGLTLTGFIFFRNELSREQFEDETLIESVDALKRRYFELLIFITTLVVLAILLANLAISHESSTSTVRNTIIINTAQSAFITSLLAVAYFVFDVISPQRIERASRALQDRLDPNLLQQSKGSLEEFLRNYNQIESLLLSAGLPYQQRLQQGIGAYSDRYQRRMSNARLAEILFRNDYIDEGLFGRIRELITLRNSIIHGAEPVVSQDLVNRSAEVLTQLRAVVPQAVPE